MRKVLVMLIILSFMTSFVSAQEEYRISINSITFYISSQEISVEVNYKMESLTELSVLMFGDAPIKRDIQKFFGIGNLTFTEVNETSAKFNLELSEKGVLKPFEFSKEISEISFVFEDGTKITLRDRNDTPTVLF